MQTKISQLIPTIAICRNAVAQRRRSTDVGPPGDSVVCFFSSPQDLWVGTAKTGVSADQVVRIVKVSVNPTA